MVGMIEAEALAVQMLPSRCIIVDASVSLTHSEPKPKIGQYSNHCWMDLALFQALFYHLAWGRSCLAGSVLPALAWGLSTAWHWGTWIVLLFPIRG